MMGLARTSLVLGVTGGLACGKSEVGRILKKMGFAVCDTDKIAHELMKKGNPVFLQVVEHFGKRILSGEGDISRGLLGEIVFKNPTELDALNRMVHPAVQSDLERWMTRAWQNQKHAAALIPLLFESGMENMGWDATLCVSSRDELVFQRLGKRGIEAADAARRVSAQMPLSEKELKADFVIQNTGTLEDLEKLTRETAHRIMAEK